MTDVGDYEMRSGAAAPLGATVEANGVNFAVVARHAEAVDVCLFDDKDREHVRFRLPDRHGDVHCGFLAGADVGLRYGLRAYGPWKPEHGHRYDPSKLLTDPYATSLDRRYAWDSRLAARGEETAPLVPKAIVAEAATPSPPLSPRPLGLIYEVNVKAFTMCHPGVPQPMRGTLAALAEPCVIEHLLGLGVDTVEVMPLTAWIDERHLPPLGLANGWGYNPVSFFAPDPGIVPGGMSEVRATLAKLHAAGLRVLLDVVFNHTGESDADGATLSLRGLDNALYYRHAPDGALTNDTGCGNTLALDRAPVVRLAMDALRHWAAAGFDGFRFDLATVLGRTARGFDAEAPLLAAIPQDPMLAPLARIAEPWDAGPDGYRLGGFPAHWHEWNDRYRDRVRRFWRGDAHAAGDFATAICGSSDVFDRTRRPSASINFVAAHDGFTVRDLLTFPTKRNDANGESNRDGHANEVSWASATPQADGRALLATLLLSRGTPMLTAGDEFGRTQQGNNNAYAQDNALTWLDWGAADGTLTEFTTRVARLRQRLQPIIADQFLEGRDTDGTGFPDALWIGSDGQELTATRWSEADLSTFGLVLARSERTALWFNRSNATLRCLLPPARRGYAWTVALDSADDARTADSDGEGVLVAARSVLVVCETASARPGRSAASTDKDVATLAAAAGIHADWHEIDGTHHRVSPASQRALLTAMRLACATRDDVRDSLMVLRSEGDVRALPLTILAAAGVAARLRVTLPSRLGQPRLRLHVRSDTGETRVVDLMPADLRPAGRIASDGQSFDRFDAPLPPLPSGLYTAHLERAPDAAARLIVHPPGCYLPPELSGDRRGFGLAAHLYALRDARDAGIGDFETLARFARLTRSQGGITVGLNPLHHLFPTDRTRASPYQPSDRSFIDPIYLDLDRVVAEFGGTSTKTMLANREAEMVALRAQKYVDYAGTWSLKIAVLREANADCASRHLPDFERFIARGGAALVRHGLFEALAESAGTVDRARWPAAWQTPMAHTGLAASYAQEIRFRSFLQWCAERQLAAARERGPRLGFYRDLAVGVARDGGEVWAAPELFAAGVSLGAPPDPFAAAGQNWNVPPMLPRALRAARYEPFIDMLTANMRAAGALRIDHILGYARQFWVPDGAAGADGAFVTYPLDDLIALTSVLSVQAQCSIVGEDLGTVPAGLREKLAAASILSYRVLWLERGGDGSFLPPADYPRLSAACLSSHDLMPFMGWTASADGPDRDQLKAAIAHAGLSAGETDDDIMVASHEMLARASSALMLVQADDLIAETEPLNVPGTDRERPNWRRRVSQHVDDLAKSPLATRTLAAVVTERGSAP